MLMNKDHFSGVIAGWSLCGAGVGWTCCECRAGAGWGIFLCAGNWML